MARLVDGSVAAVYDRSGKMWFRRSTDGGITFGTPVLVAADPDCWLTNANLLPLKDGTLLYFWNERPRAALAYQNRPAPPGVLTRPFLIRMSRSTDLGRTWSAPESLYTAGTSYQDGCWEPAGLQLPTGEVHVYFSNEAPFPDTDEQDITLIRSQDGGKTWSKPGRIALRKGHRDGMPAPLLLADNRSLAVAIEDNGVAGDRFKPTILSSPDDWRSAPVGGDSPFRHPSLAEPLPPTWYGGAPFLARLPSGLTLLSYQESADGTLDHCRMAVCVGDADARNFANKSYPLPPPARGNQAWNSLFVKDADTVTAITTANVNNVRGVWAIDGRVR
jgi:hypothetical protein